VGSDCAARTPTAPGSTLLRILATSVTADAGTVRLLDRDPSDAKALLEIRRRLGYLPQDVRFCRPFTAFEYVDT
jgi:ABC-2 type transport system ATP-binding protein